MRKIILPGMLFLLWGASGACRGNSALPLKVTIKSDKPSYRMGDPVAMSCRLENISNKTITLLAIENFDDIFAVKDAQDKEVAWQGPRVSRPLPSYATIKGHGFLEKTCSLEFYDLSAPGKYSVRFRKWAYGADSNTVEIEIVSKKP